MEVSELTLWILRLAVLALMYLFLLALVLAVRADARAGAAPREAPARRARPDAAPAPAPAPRRLRLEVVRGTEPTTGGQYILTGPLDIGRSELCGISLPNRFVSTRHARIYPEGDAWIVEDLGSTNGSQINGRPLTAPHALQAGDRLGIGDTEFLVQ